MKNILYPIILLMAFSFGCTHNITYLEIMDDSSLINIIERGDAKKYSGLTYHALYSGWDEWSEGSRYAGYSFIMAECYGNKDAYRNLIGYLSRDSNYIKKRNGLELLTQYRKLLQIEAFNQK